IPTSDPGYNSATGVYTITIGSSLPDVSSTVAIVGPGADKLLIRPPTSGNPTFRIFRVTTTGAVSFAGMTIMGGVSGSGLTGDGGGIQNVNTAKLTITNCTFNGNGASSGGG